MGDDITDNSQMGRRTISSRLSLRSVRSQLFAGMGLVIFGFVGVSLIIVVQVADNFGEEEIGRNLRFARDACQGYMETRQELLQDKSRSLASAPYLKATLSIEDLDYETAYYLASQISETGRTDLLLLLDFNGNLIADAASKKRHGKSLMQLPRTEPALNGEEGTAVWAYEQDVFLVTLSPVIAGNSVLGVLVLGQRIDQAFADHVRLATGRDVTMFLQQECLARSFANDRTIGQNLDQDFFVALKAKQADNGAVVQLDLAGESSLYSSLEMGELSIVLSRSLVDFAGLSHRAGKWLLLLSAGIAMAAVVVCLSISKRLSHPIAEVVQASEQMANGDLSIQVTVTGNDELASLSQSFNTMAQRIQKLVADVQSSADLARAASQAKSNFLANISHEIRTPLNGIIGFTALLIENAESEPDPDSEQQKAERDTRLEWLGTIDSSSQNLLAVVDNILDIGKLEQGELDIELGPCDPHLILRNVYLQFEEQAQKKGLQFEIANVHSLPDVISSDEVRFQQLVSHLVDNAIKFTRSGFVRISAELIQHSESSRIRLVVSDSGIGISRENLETIFEPFFQVDGSLSREFGGAGLGLSICKQTAAALSGHLEVKSQLGEGTTVICEIDPGAICDGDETDKPKPEDDIVLPTYRKPLSDVEFVLETERTPDKPQLVEGTLSGKVLVVDDGDPNRRLLTLVLIKAGAQVVEATNGREAIDKFIADPADLILMDMQMPVLNGYEATRELRSQGVTVPIIALTAHAMKGDREKCMQAGCSSYLTKPILPLELIDLVNESLRASNNAPAASDCP